MQSWLKYPVSSVLLLAVQHRGRLLREQGAPRSNHGPMSCSYVDACPLSMLRRKYMASCNEAACAALAMMEADEPVLLPLRTVLVARALISSRHLAPSASTRVIPFLFRVGCVTHARTRQEASGESTAVGSRGGKKAAQKRAKQSASKRKVTGPHRLHRVCACESSL